MNCPDFAHKLEEYLDGSRDLRAVLADHAVGCPSCRELLAWADRIVTLPPSEPPDPTPEWTQRVVQAVLRDRRARRRRRTVAFALAASLVLAALILPILRWTATPVVNPMPIVAKNADPPPIPEQPPEPVPELSLGPALRFGPASLEATRNLASEAARQAASLSAGAPGLRPKADPRADPVADLGRNATGGLEPVVRSTRRAFDAWLDLLPVTTDEKPGL